MGDASKERRVGGKSTKSAFWVCGGTGSAFRLCWDGGDESHNGDCWESVVASGARTAAVCGEPGRAVAGKREAR